ncbi:MAG: lysylphosphatidylglycerol synthase transmembrane domain-containing protein, partial [Longimicrobiales bacterium]|nr:lysylphosphatidylglycerol synthase transmembrane domain-containing protein [Longimicrobiales bacterium]
MTRPTGGEVLARRIFRATVSVALLAVVAWSVDLGEVVARLSELQMGWVAAAVVVSILQVVVSAWRWRYTAGRLGLSLPMGRAVREYYLATFLNQLLPGGVVGDVSRAWRHARDEGDLGEEGDSREEGGSGAEGRPGGPPASRLSTVHAVVLERASGQAVMTLVAAVAAVLLLAPRTAGLGGLLPRHPLTSVPAEVTVPAALALMVFGGWAVGRLLRRLVRLPALERLEADARAALLGPALPVQAVASLSVVGSYVVVFVCGARALGLDTSTGLLALLAPPVLVAMLVPVSVAGWG